MRTKLIQLEQRVQELEKMAREIGAMARKFEAGGNNLQPELSIKGRTWYLAALGLIEKLYPERAEWFENCYSSNGGMTKFLDAVSSTAFEKRHYLNFLTSFAQARGLVLGSLERAKSLQFDALIQLSSALVSDEFETAHQLFDVAKGDESILRAAGTVARVALERHLHTIADARSVSIEVNPPNKKKPEAQDVINSLAKAGVITAIQKSELETLFRIGNHCAHPNEAVKASDVDRLIERGKGMAATII